MIRAPGQDQEWNMVRPPPRQDKGKWCISAKQQDAVISLSEILVINVLAL